MLNVKIKYTAKSFLEDIKNKDIQIISHFDTDGITAAAIIIKALKRQKQKFSVRIIKSLNKHIIEKLDKNKITLFLDLASNNMQDIENANLQKTYIIDHHEITEKIPKTIEIINPQLLEKQKISSAGLAYLFAKELDKQNKDLAKLAIIGMIGDRMETEISKINSEILKDSDIQTKKGLMLYPSTKPLNRVLEYSSSPFIEGVTGNATEINELLREINLPLTKGRSKNLIDLTEEEMQKFTTAVILRDPKITEDQLIGNLFLVKLFGKLEDAREVSAKINACSRNGFPQTAIAMCLEDEQAKKKVERIHIKHKQTLIESLKHVDEIKKIQGEGFVIFNAKDKIKDTVIGTIMSIKASKKEYQEGTILIGMAKDKQNNAIKISARSVGKNGKNLREFLAEIMESFKGEIGGHKFAAGCSINLDEEVNFIEKICQNFEKEIIAQ